MTKDMSQAVDLCVVIVNYNNQSTLRKSVASVLRHCNSSDYIIAVVDNGSTDESLQSIQGMDAKVKIFKTGRNLGFACGNNHAFRFIKARTYYLHNSDAYLQGDTVNFAIKKMRVHSSIGILGLPLVFPDGTPQSHAYTRMTVVKKMIQCASLDVFAKSLLERNAPLRNLILRRGSRFTNTVMAGQNLPVDRVYKTNGVELIDVDWVCGASMLISLECVEALGGFDENFFMYYEDEDFCLRAIKSSFRVVTLDALPVIHDFGWGKEIKRNAISQSRLKSARFYVNKHFRRNVISWSLLRSLIYFFPKSW